MTPKELREAANRTTNDLIFDRRINGDKVMQMCQYILATIRDDDDEPMSWDEAARQEDKTVQFHVETGASTWGMYSFNNEIARFKTRRQFRRLCEGLGIQSTPEDLRTKVEQAVREMAKGGSDVSGV